MPPILNKAPVTIGTTKYEIKDGIVYVERLARIQHTIENFKKMIAQRLEYTEGHSYPVIIFGQDMISMDKDSRGYLTNEGSKSTLSRAFVVDKKQGRLQLNFFIQIYSQPIPTQIFESLEPAVEWSKQFRQP